MSEREFDHLFDLDRIISESVSNEYDKIEDFYLGELFEEAEEKPKKKEKKKRVVDPKKPLATVPVSTLQSIGAVQNKSSIVEDVMNRVSGYIKRLEEFF